jgi:hypothetical protein
VRGAAQISIYKGAQNIHFETMSGSEWHQWQPAKPKEYYPFGGQSGQFGGHPGGVRRPPDEVLHEAYVQVERKSFKLSLKRNDKGVYLRITEGVNGRFSSVVVPDSGLKEFQRLLGEMIAADVPPPAA